MPNLNANVTYTAKATMTNPTAKGFSYSAELYLGVPKAATSGKKSFSLAAGESATVSFPVAMPNYEAVFPVYLDVFVGTELVAAYEATEKVTTVILPTVIVGPITWM